MDRSPTCSLAKTTLASLWCFFSKRVESIFLYLVYLQLEIVICMWQSEIRILVVARISLADKLSTVASQNILCSSCEVIFDFLGWDLWVSYLSGSFRKVSTTYLGLSNIFAILTIEQPSFQIFLMTVCSVLFNTLPCGKVDCYHKRCELDWWIQIPTLCTM